MNLYNIVFTFPIEFERTHGASELHLDIVARDGQKAINKAKATLTFVMRRAIKEIKINKNGK